MRIVLALIVTACAAGCSTTRGTTTLLREGAGAPDLIAILPPANSSNSLAAPDTMRRVAAGVLVRHGYVPMASPAQEDQLRKAGMSDGGHLRALKVADLARALGVQGVVFADISSFDDLNIGVYRSRVVAAEWTMFDAVGTPLWKATGKAAKRVFSLNPADSFVQGLTTSLIEKALKVHLLMEAADCAAMIAHAAPDWPVTTEGKLEDMRYDLKP